MDKPAMTPDKAVDISVVITAHREGIIAGATARSAKAAIAHLAQETGRKAEVLVILDRADTLTGSVLAEAFGDTARLVETSLGDPGQARNAGTQLAAGTCITFLDADDLWSFNWLTEAWRFVELRPDAVAHSNCNVIFGKERNLWWHISSEGPLFDPLYLEWSNYWDAMAFARTDIYRRFPFKPNDLSIGVGHEDWHWNVVTIAAGIAHIPVPNTIHFKRRREGSVSAKVNERQGTIWPVDWSPAKVKAEIEARWAKAGG
jgi:glycosyltransferase involved in cell wall biosynthesis